MLATQTKKKWFKRVLTGYTDKTGSYLYNLNLSLKRAERVVCILMSDPVKANDNRLTSLEKRKYAICSPLAAIPSTVQKRLMQRAAE